jgi:hypothetical protein
MTLLLMIFSVSIFFCIDSHFITHTIGARVGFECLLTLLGLRQKAKSQTDEERPSFENLYDRRVRPRRPVYAPHAYSPCESDRDRVMCSVGSPRELPGDVVFVPRNSPMLSDVAHPLFQSSFEYELIHHFIKFFFPSVTLTTSDDAYVSLCLLDLTEMMSQGRAVKHDILASYALNKR